MHKIPKQEADPILKHKTLAALILFTAGLSLMWASFWQMEILNITMTTKAFEFNFMGFGGFNLDWWSWRDVFYMWIVAGTSCIAIGSYLAGTIKERRKHKK